MSSEDNVITRVKSEGEERIKTYLDESNISYQHQYEIPSLVGISGYKPLIFDFRIDTNPVMFMEFQGPQHYIPSVFAERYPHLMELSERENNHDCRKARYCKRHSIPLIIITARRNTC